MSVKEKMNSKFRNLQGGLFAAVTKADVGENAGKLLQNGYSIMGWADPFFPDPSIPASVKKVILEEIDRGTFTHYTMPMGDRSLRETIANRLYERYKLNLDPGRNILITPGSDSGLLYAMMPFIDSGDEVLIPDPSYPSNFLDVELCGGHPVHVPLHESQNYQIDIEEFERKYSSKTKMVLITHPNNPTGTVFRKESILALCDFVKKHDLILVCDQAFEDHIYDGIEFVAPAAVPGMLERTVTVFSISKGLGLSGFRVGYIVADDKVMDIYYGGAVNVLGATNTLAQVAANAALQDRSLFAAYHEKLQHRRNMAYEVFSSIPNVTATKPESGILSWLNISKLGSCQEVASSILKNAKISINEGSPYGFEGEGHIRIVHACFYDDADALKAFQKIKTALCAFSNNK